MFNTYFSGVGRCFGIGGGGGGGGGGWEGGGGRRLQYTAFMWFKIVLVEKSHPLDCGPKLWKGGGGGGSSPQSPPFLRH